MAEETTKIAKDMEALLPHYDVHQHLETIQSMLRHMVIWHDQREGDLKKASDLCYEAAHQDGDRELQLDDNYGEAFYSVVYGDAAFSSIVIGALAPLFEGIFSHEFRTLKGHDERTRLPRVTHRRNDLPHAEFWEHYYAVDKKGKLNNADRNVHYGSMQILKALGILDRFPPLLYDITEALFYVRNRALHFGYEWPLEKRNEFKDRMLKEPTWQYWFQFSADGRQLWIFSVTDVFLEECFETAVETVHEFAKLQWERIKCLPPRQDMPPHLKDQYVTEDIFDDVMTAKRTYGRIRDDYKGRTL